MDKALSLVASFLATESTESKQLSLALCPAPRAVLTSKALDSLRGRKAQQLVDAAFTDEAAANAKAMSQQQKTTRTDELVYGELDTVSLAAIMEKMSPRSGSGICCFLALTVACEQRSVLRPRLRRWQARDSRSFPLPLCQVHRCRASG